jgi:hypothetical protein
VITIKIGVEIAGHASVRLLDSGSEKPLSGVRDLRGQTATIH